MTTSGTMTTCSEALRLVLDSVDPLPARKTSLEGALGLVLAGTLVSPETVPPFTNSAMDGYAVRADDCAAAAPGAPVSLEVLSDLPAGSVALHDVRPGTAIRIMTGAPLPGGADITNGVAAVAGDGHAHGGAVRLGPGLGIAEDERQAFRGGIGGEHAAHGRHSGHGDGAQHGADRQDDDELEKR